MGKRPRQWPPLPGPVPDKRLAYAPKNPKVTIETEDGWVKVGWLDEIVAEDWSTARVRTVLTTDTTNPGANDDWTVTTGTTSNIGQGWIQNTAPRQRTVEEQYLSDRVKALTEEATAAMNVAEYRLQKIERLQRELRDLSSWLLGVGPIEDPEIPGLYLCGICHARTDRPHKEGCPLAPEIQ